MSNIDDTLTERGNRYGDFADHAEVTQSIKVSIASGNNWHTLDDDMKECLEMVAHKIGRIVNGDPNYVDSWTDIIGYARLVEKRLIAEQDEEPCPEGCPGCAADAAIEAEALLVKAFRASTGNEARIKDALKTLMDAGIIRQTNESAT